MENIGYGDQALRGVGLPSKRRKYRRNTDLLTKELSKRCFWVAYDVDRVASFILGRPTGLPDDAIDVEVSELAPRRRPFAI